MSEKLVSLLIPVYNQINNIDKAMQSVINQKHFEGIEVLVHDDGSNDGTSERLDKYEVSTHHAIKLEHHSNHGYGSSMNHMLDQASGKYVMILEPDDELSENWSDAVFEALQDSCCPVVKFMYEIDGEESNLEKALKSKESFDESSLVLELFMHHPSIWSAAYKTSFLRSNGIRFEEAPGAGWVDNLFQFQTLLLASGIDVRYDRIYRYDNDQADNSMHKFDVEVPLRRMLAVKHFLKYQMNDCKFLDGDLRVAAKAAYSFRTMQFIDLVINKYKLADYESISLMTDGLLDYCDADKLDLIGEEQYAEFLRHFRKTGWLPIRKAE